MNRSSSQVFSAPKTGEPRRRGSVVTALGFVQILSWGSSYYLLAVLAKPIVADTGWSLSWIVGGLSIGLLAGGVVSPRVGNMIEHHGGRLVLACSSILFTLGLGCLGLVQILPVYLAAWLIIGVAMGAGLYDSAFATLGRIYGKNARPAIAMLTLFGGLASTVCWPLTAFLSGKFGWRGTCFVYAGLHLAIALPLNALMLPRGSMAESSEVAQAPSNFLVGGFSSRKKTTEFVLVAAIVALGEGLFSVISVHLLSILQTRGMELAAAVALGSLIGPAQVGARMLDMLFGRHYHPIWTMIASTALITVGLALLIGRFPITAVAVMVYGGGVGLASIARGTVPLGLFGPVGYPSLMGRLALPSLVSEAVSPSIASFLLGCRDASLTLILVMGMAVANMVLVLLLWAIAKTSPPQ